MRENTVLAVFDLFSVFFDHFIFSGTIPFIKRTIAEQTVDVLIAVMAGIILTRFVTKECS